MIMVKILAFAGSTRGESFNKKLIKVAVEGARAAGAEVTLVDLRDFPMPLFDGDLEAASGLPEQAKRLKKLFLGHDGLMISSPEYNSSIPGVLKNAIDWVSRSEPGESALSAFVGKTAVLMSASPGQLGGSRALVVVRMMLGNIKVIVLPDQVSVSKANEAFNSDGSLKDAKQAASVQKLGKTLAETIAKLKG
ncbi:MAG: NAD(P)H-dependent oxidoreductase [Planctomycetes bacterium]|nr:NAD(P)H-dependent oxidoreductase [Planctomycetota bacterium]